MSKVEIKQPIVNTHMALAAILDSLSVYVFTLDCRGRVDYASRSWLNFARQSGGDWVRFEPGADYLAVCKGAAERGDPLAQQAFEGIAAVLAGRVVKMSLEYPSQGPMARQRWFLMNVDPLPAEHGGVVISHIDITEHKQMETALADREAKFKGIYESNIVPIAFWDLDGRITNANDAYLQLTGYSRSELDEGKLRCSELTPLGQLHLDKQAIQEAKTKGVCTPYEKDYLRRDGQRVPVLIGGGMLPGMPDRGVVFAIDLSERKKAEERLRASEEKNRAILQALPDLMFVQSQEGVYLDYHAKDPKALLVEPEKFLGKNMRQVLPAELAQAFVRCFELLRDASEPVIHEYSLFIDGQTRSYEARMVRHNSDQILSVVRDITERKRAEEEIHRLKERLEAENVYLRTEVFGAQLFGKQAEESLRTSEERFRVLYEENPSMYFTVDEQGVVISVNRFGAEQLGYTVDDLIGQSVLKVFHQDDQDAVLQQLKQCLENPRRLYCWELRKVRKDGSEMWVREAARAVRGTNGKSVVFVVCEDVTERRQAEDALRDAYNEMERRVQERTLLLSDTVKNLEHEITERKRVEEEIHRLKERLEAENVYLRKEVSEAHTYREIIGESEGIKRVLQQVEQVAGTDMTVLILGETGTGKELVARAVHERSVRRERSLVKVNCSALPGELIESELFGHEKGAFTGATGRQVGRFELADGGTIFLDEVGDLPLKLQAKLLRVLQEGEFERLGSGKTIKVDVRVIAATNRNLAEVMQRGRFRPDLYYRLNVYPISLPPLRERVKDIELLAEVFLREASRRLGRLFDPISAEVLEVLRRYQWPGNVRELQNVIERTAVVSSGRRLQLPEAWGSAEDSKAAGTLPAPTADAAQFHPTGSLEEKSLNQVGKNYILRILEQTGWRVEGPKGAAIILGLNPSTLRSRMQKLGIRRPGRSRAEVPE
jgi:formate hydrogenlyase transcriptional activator